MKMLRKVLLRGKEFGLRISMLEEKGSRHQTDDISDLDKVQKIDSREQFYKKQMQIVDAELEKYQKFKKRAFTGYMEEMITPKEYRSYVAEYEEEMSKLEKHIGDQIYPRSNDRLI